MTTKLAFYPDSRADLGSITQNVFFKAGIRKEYLVHRSYFYNIYQFSLCMNNTEVEK